jgi:hypothetical protein
MKIEKKEMKKKKHLIYINILRIKIIIFKINLLFLF